MKFTGRGQPLTRSGLNKALDLLGLGPDDAAYIWTVVEVETAGVTQGFGFRVDRRPQILFERHIFCKRTDGCFDGEAPDVSGPAATVRSPSSTPNWKKQLPYAPRRNWESSRRLNQRPGEWAK